MKLAEALKIIQSAPLNAPPLQVALLCGFTPLHLEAFLRAELCRSFPDRLPVVQSGLYDDLIGNLQRAAEMGDLRAALVVIEWSDLDPRLGLRRLGGWDPSQLPDVLSEVGRQCELLARSTETLARKVPVAACLPTLPLPPISFTSPAHASEFTLELRRRVATLAVDLARISGVRIVDSQRLDAISPAPRLDVNSDLSSGFPYLLRHASALAESLVLLALNLLPKKGLITDLDDTLWRGILGEVGVQGIFWDLDHRSQIHGLYQQLLRSLAASGTLVAVASRNDRALVEQAFAERDLILRNAEIFPFEVHWGAKSESVSRILATWNIAAGDVVCVDDSAMDLAEIKSAHPAAECLQFPSENPQAAYELLERLRGLFGKSAISSEDKIRAASLRANAQLQHDVEQMLSPSTEDFVRHLDGTLTLRVEKNEIDPRCLELVNKTNQFNLNGCRFQEAEWQNWLRRPGAVLVAASYRDKYGPLGKIAVIAGDLQQMSNVNGGSPEKRALCIRTWVMSCRAFSRRIEYECVRWLFDRLEVDELEFDFLATARNAPMQNFLQQIMNAAVASKCRLTRDQFLRNCPETSHVVEEVA